MSRKALSAAMAALSTLLVILEGAGCGQECAPGDFSGGRACDEDGRTVLSCVYNDCFEPPCSEGWFVHEAPCPSVAPRCVDASPGEVACVGEVIGSCATVGTVTCEDPFTEVYCADDGAGMLRLMRGPCAPGERCIGPGEAASQVGCSGP